jgi:hypothetical protein
MVASLSFPYGMSMSRRMPMDLICCAGCSLHAFMIACMVLYFYAGFLVQSHSVDSSYPLGSSHLSSLPGGGLECLLTACIYNFTNSISSFHRKIFCQIKVYLWGLIMFKVTFIRFKSALLTDERVRIMNEIITGIRVIKMYAWENAFKKVITSLRK